MHKQFQSKSLCNNPLNESTLVKQKSEPASSSRCSDSQQAQNQKKLKEKPRLNLPLAITGVDLLSVFREISFENQEEIPAIELENKKGYFKHEFKTIKTGFRKLEKQPFQAVLFFRRGICKVTPNYQQFFINENNSWVQEQSRNHQILLKERYTAEIKLYKLQLSSKFSIDEALYQSALQQLQNWISAKVSDQQFDQIESLSFKAKTLKQLKSDLDLQSKWYLKEPIYEQIMQLLSSLEQHQ